MMCIYRVKNESKESDLYEFFQLSGNKFDAVLSFVGFSG